MCSKKNLCNSVTLHREIVYLSLDKYIYVFIFIYFPFSFPVIGHLHNKRKCVHLKLDLTLTTKNKRHQGGGGRRSGAAGSPGKPRNRWFLGWRLTTFVFLTAASEEIRAAGRWSTSSPAPAAFRSRCVARTGRVRGAPARTPTGAH